MGIESPSEDMEGLKVQVKEKLENVQFNLKLLSDIIDRLNPGQLKIALESVKAIDDVIVTTTKHPGWLSDSVRKALDSRP